MKRRLGIAGIAVGAWLLTVAIVAPVTPAQAAQVGFSFKDSFSSNRYNGDDGTDVFDGPWWESLDWGGSNKGAVSVVEDRDCPHSICARIAGQNEFWGTGLARRANIEGATIATLKFKYRIAVDEPTSGRLEVAVFDGWNWTTVDSIDLSGNNDSAVHSRSYDVTPHASKFFTVGFFAFGQWSGAAFIDDVKVTGFIGDATIITESSTTSSTTSAPSTTTTSSAPTTTAPSVTTTAPPATTTTTAAPTTTTRPPSGTTRPPTTPTTSTTSTTPPATAAPPTTRPPSTELPLTNDQRYKDKAALAFLMFDDETTAAMGELATMPGEAELPEPGPVTRIMASITVTAVTIRSHLLSAIALGLLIAAAAMIGLGRRGEPAAES